MNYNIDIFKYRILQLLHKDMKYFMQFPEFLLDNYDIYLAGGALRDCIIDKSVKDYDLFLIPKEEYLLELKEEFQSDYDLIEIDLNNIDDYKLIVTYANSKIHENIFKYFNNPFFIKCTFNNEIGSNKDNDYGTNINISHIYEAFIDSNIPFNIIFTLEKNITNVIDDFNCNLSQIYLNFNSYLENNFNTDLDDIFISPNFIKGYMNKHIEIRKENTDTYYNKMLEYFANLGYKIESY